MYKNKTKYKKNYSQIYFSSFIKTLQWLNTKTNNLNN